MLHHAHDEKKNAQSMIPLSIYVCVLRCIERRILNPPDNPIWCREKAAGSEPMKPTAAALVSPVASPVTTIGTLTSTVAGVHPHHTMACCDSSFCNLQITFPHVKPIGNAPLGSHQARKTGTYL